MAATFGEELTALALELMPQADRVGEIDERGHAAALYDGDQLLGYAFRTDDLAPIPAYSGHPIATLVLLDTQGVIVDLRIVEHSEPILVVGISEQDLAEHVAQYVGADAGRPIRIGDTASARDREAQMVDGITGATITSMVLNASITRAARQVVASYGLPLPQREADATAREQAAAFEPSVDRDGQIWLEVWPQRVGRIIVLSIGLFTLAVVLFMQDWLTRNPGLLNPLRIGFLLYTLIFIGWYAAGQLSVVNVLTFVGAIISGFSWDTFLIDPMLFILWSFVAVSLLLWGRGVYCGWLCPFGALQELTSKLAQRLGIRELRIPPMLHERLLAIKYVILLALFGLSLRSMSDAVWYSEVEPFKTAINMHFVREWPFVAYAAAMVLVSLVNGKFFCKYVCPLGAALALGSHFRIFDWLRRRRECGQPCQVCAVQCPSQAIRPTGQIDANECHHCLDCQVTYYDVYRCPPLVERRKRAERRGQTIKVVHR